MNILVVGASQGTGALCVRAALNKGYRVTAFARSPQKLVLDHPNLRRQVGDFHKEVSVQEAVKGHDAVIVTASATQLRAFKDNPTYFSQGTAYVVNAMKASGVKRLVVLSALGAGESLRLLNPILRTIMVRWLLKTAYADHGRQEALVRQSGLEWVIARPSRLSNGPARSKYIKTTAIEPVPMVISRADTADFLVDACGPTADAWLGHAMQLGG